jgi:SAM-dependent methyltransferase
MLSGLRAALRPDHAGRLIQELAATGEIRSALDIGCGASSPLTCLRPTVRTLGIDASASAVETARQRQVHDDYLVGDILELEPSEILARARVDRFDLVTLFDVVEHLPRRLGFQLLEQCEALTSKWIVVQTPNGFLPQGPEFGNEYQRHHSGWFPHDFESLAYSVRGCDGLKRFHGYAGQFTPNLPGIRFLDAFGWQVLGGWHHPHRAFNLLAFKDVRGVPARLGTSTPLPQR